MSWIPPRGLRLSIGPDKQVLREPIGPLLPYLRRFLSDPDEGRRGLVLLGAFGSGKTTLSAALAGPSTVVIPLRLLVRGGSLEARWQALVGDPQAVAEGRLRVILDGLDEVGRPGEGGFAGLFEAVTALAGERWLLTARTGTFRSAGREAGEQQVDSLIMPGVETLEIAPLDPAEVARALGREPIPEVCTSPVLLRLCLEAGLAEARTPAELVEGWLRWTGCELEGLTEAAWLACADRGLSEESASFPAEARRDLLAGQPIERLMVSDADGRLRFGHRSLYDFLVARRLAPWIAGSQGGGPNAASGRHLSEAMRVFLAGLVPQPEARGDAHWVEVPAGNWVSGGALSPDERPLIIRHLSRPALLARRPVSEDQIARWLADAGDRPPGYWFLRHWIDGRPPPGTGDCPAYHLRPSDADAYAAWAGARLPSWQEWEKGVRGISGRRWPWGDRPDTRRANTAEGGAGRPLPPPGPQGPTGVWAAAGDVFEITSSFYRDRPDRGRVVMGGSYAHTLDVARAGLRLSHTLSGHLKLGLRLARSGPL